MLVSIVEMYPDAVNEYAEGMNILSTIFVLLGVCVAFALSWWALIRLEKPLEHMIVLAVALLGVLSLAIMIPGSIPDEPAHIQTAYRYANVMLFKPYATESGGLLVRKEDVPLGRFSRYVTPYAEGYSDIARDWRFFCSAEGTEMVEEEGRDVRTGAAAYLPSAVGIAIARLLHLGTWPMIYLARLCNLACFVLLLWWAVRLTPLKKYLFALVGLIPTCIQSAGSLSYDAPIMGMALVITAYLLRVIYEYERVGFREWALCCVAAFLLFPCKLIYGTVFLMLVLVPREKTGGMGRKLLFLGSVIIAGLGGFVLFNLPNVTKQLTTMDTGINFIAVRESPVYSLEWLLHHPVDGVRMLFESIRQNSDFYLRGMFGNRLVRFDNTVNWSVFFLVCYVLAAMHNPSERPALPFRHRLAGMAAFLLTTLGAFVLMLVIYTPVGSVVIEGVQGRYFLPLLPLFLLCLDSGHVRIDDHASRWLTVFVLALNGGVMADLLRWIMQNQF